MKNIIIFDLDGTLALNEHRQHFLQQEPKNWDAFYEACDKDVPNSATIGIVSIIKGNNAHAEERGEDGIRIIIMTGRSEKVLAKTLAWLENQFIDYYRLFMRPEKNFKPLDMLYEKWLTEIGPDNVLCAFSSDTTNIQYSFWKSKNIPWFQVHK